MRESGKWRARSIRLDDQPLVGGVVQGDGNAVMQSPMEIELEFDAVRVAWCMCERCGALGPKLTTLVRNDREYRSSLQSGCCGAWSSRSDPHGACMASPGVARQESSYGLDVRTG